MDMSVMGRWTVLSIGWLAVVCVLGGCASMQNGLAPEKVDASSLPHDAALVVLSTGAAERCVSSATMLNLAPAGAAYGKSGILGINVDSYLIKSDFPDHQGNLNVFKVKPGNYQLYPFPVNPHLAPVRVPKAEFSLQPGETVYLGEFFMSLACGFHNVTEFRGQEARDMALLRERNPALADRTISKRLPVFSGYVAETGK